MNRSKTEPAHAPAWRPGPLAKSVVFALVWLAMLLALNLGLEDDIDSFIAYGIPVAVVAWHRFGVGLLVAALSTLSAAAGEPIGGESREPAYVEGLLAYGKLSIIALAFHLAGAANDGERRRA